MLATITLPGGRMCSLALPDEKRHFYKKLGESLAGITETGKAVIQTALGSIQYDLRYRSGTMCIQKETDTMKFPADNDADYPTKYLTCVNEEKNNYKFYRLEVRNGQTIATYGRIGAAKGELFGERACTYPIDMFWVKYHEKIAKGYTDKSDIYISGRPQSCDTQDDASARTAGQAAGNQLSLALYEKLLRFARNSIERTCASVAITQGMIEESNRLLSLLYQAKDLPSFNTTLKELLAVCPRKVWKVETLLAKDSSEIPAIIQREEDLVLSMQVLLPDNKKKETEGDYFTSKQVLISGVSADKREKVIQMLSPELQSKVMNIYRINPARQRQKFDDYVKRKQITEIKHLWHGSRNQNWLSIVENGLLLYPNAAITGKMFGDGIYFAPNSKKSWGYTSGRGAYWTKGTDCTAFMGLYATAYGSPLDTDSAMPFNENILARQNKDCVHAHSGRSLMNDEIIFYNESAILLTYLVEFAA